MASQEDSVEKATQKDCISAEKSEEPNNFAMPRIQGTNQDAVNQIPQASPRSLHGTAWFIAVTAILSTTMLFSYFPSLRKDVKRLPDTKHLMILSEDL